MTLTDPDVRVEIAASAHSALYHLCVQPNNIADVGAKPFYSTFSCWDTFRAAGPMYTILYPEKAAERIREVFNKFYLPKGAVGGMRDEQQAENFET